MYTQNRCVDPRMSQPPLNNHNPYVYNPYYPIWGCSPNNLRAMPAEPMPQLLVQPSAYPCAMNYPSANSSHTCCNQYNPNHVYCQFKPPFQHEVPPSQFYHQVPILPYPSAFSPYFVPPPPPCPVYHHGSCDDMKSRHHCCGCANHVCHGRNDVSVKTGEEKAGTEDTNMKGNKSSLISSPYYQFPMVWSLPTNMNQEEQMSNKKLPQSEQEKGSQISSPIIWVPGCDKSAEPVKDKEVVSAPAVSEVTSPRKIKIVPLTFIESAANDEGKSKKQSAACEDVKVDAVYLAKNTENNDGQQALTKKDDKSSGNNQKVTEATSKEENGQKADTSRKQSRLPPVCLRVDPLPKKKSSRYPSPPNKHNRDQSLKDNMGMESQHDQVTMVKPSKRHEMLGRWKKVAEEDQGRVVKVIDVVDKSHGEVEEVHCDRAIRSHMQLEGGVTDGAQDKESVNAADCTEQESKTVHGVVDLKVEKSDNARPRIVSEADAAVSIQSAYRGYSVRRWQPLDKLRKIMKVRKDMMDVRRQIDNLIASNEEVDAKRQVAISETIMSLLLQLDTIQGLHPYVREVRKSIARELICLQEMFDMLVNKTTSNNETPNAVEQRNGEGMQASAINSCLCDEGHAMGIGGAEFLESEGSSESENVPSIEIDCTENPPCGVDDTAMPASHLPMENVASNIVEEHKSDGDTYTYLNESVPEIVLGDGKSEIDVLEETQDQNNAPDSTEISNFASGIVEHSTIDAVQSYDFSESASEKQEEKRGRVDNDESYSAIQFTEFVQESVLEDNPPVLAAQDGGGDEYSDGKQAKEIISSENLDAEGSTTGEKKTDPGLFSVYPNNAEAGLISELEEEIREADTAASMDAHLTPVLEEDVEAPVVISEDAVDGSRIQQEEISQKQCNTNDGPSAEKQSAGAAEKLPEKSILIPPSGGEGEEASEARLLQKLHDVCEQQMAVITTLNNKVKHLEQKLARMHEKPATKATPSNAHKSRKHPASPKRRVKLMLLRKHARSISV